MYRMKLLYFYTTDFKRNHKNVKNMNNLFNLYFNTMLYNIINYMLLLILIVIDTYKLHLLLTCKEVLVSFWALPLMITT